MNKSVTRTGCALLCLLFSCYSQLVAAACSEYMGQASINEAGKVGFVEVKLLNGAITSSTYRNWQLDICYDKNGKDPICATDLSLSDATLDNNVYLVLDFKDIPNNKAFDIRLKDNGGDTIDYLSVDDTEPEDTQCTLDFNSSIRVTNSHDYYRHPDGSGNWTSDNSGNSDKHSQGDVNTGSDSSNPDISINDVTVSQGDDATFTISMSASSTSDVSFDYYTFDNSDEKISYYTSTNTSAIISAGNTSTTVSIDTENLKDKVTRDFSLFIENPNNANIINHIGNATITPAATSVHHYQIIHNDRALTCKAEEITIKACEVEDCSTLSTQNITLDFMVDDAQLGDAITFLGSTTVNLQHLTPATLTLSLDNTVPSGINELMCSTADCKITFDDAGFIFSAIENQVAGQSFSDISIAAVEAVDDDGNLRCDPDLSFADADIKINLSQENVTPSGTTGMDFLIVDDDTRLKKYPEFTQVTLEFFNSVATISRPNYLDAGEIQLRASLETASGVDISGISNRFWVSPATLELSAQTDGTALNATSSTANPSHKAGSDFTLAVTAVNSLGNNTTNYNPGKMQLKLTRTGPTSGSNEGKLSYAEGKQLTSDLLAEFKDISLTEFTSGSSSYENASYSEVGLINLDIQDSNYGGDDIIISGNDINIGRFIPDHFTLNTSDKQLTGDLHLVSTCNNQASTFNYMGQPELLLDFEIQAQNKAGEVTKNYFDHADSAQDFAKASIALVAEDSNDGNDLSLRLSSHSASWLDGAYTINNAKGSFNRLSTGPDGPFENLLIGVSLDDGESSGPLSLLTDLDMQATTSTSCSSDQEDSTACNAKTLLGSANIRYGRWYIENNFGPETQDLPMFMSLQYWNGSSFVTNLDDSCTSYDGETINNYAFDNSGLNPALETAPTVKTGSGIDTFINGTNTLFPLMISAPGAYNVGHSYYIYGGSNDITPDWLKYDWDSDDSYDDNPKGLASFGQYHGNDRIIYWREVN